MGNRIDTTALPESLADDLIELIDELRLSGFNVGIAQYTLTQDLLLALAAQGQFPCSAAKLRNYLTPILSKTPGQQETFFFHFDVWLDRHPDFKAFLIQENEQDDTQKVLEPKNAMVAISRRSKPWPWILAGGLLLLAAIAAAIHFTPPSRHPLEDLAGTVVNTEGVPIGDASLSFEGKQILSDREGGFYVNYPASDGEAELTVNHPDFKPLVRQIILANDNSDLILELERRAVDPPIPIKSGSFVQIGEDLDLEGFREIVTRINDLAEKTASPVRLSRLSSIFHRYFKWIRGIGTGLPPACFAIWWCWKRYRRNLMLKKGASRDAPKLERIRVRGAAAKLFRGELFRRTVQQFRVHGEVVSKEIDAASTVYSTLQKGGWFTAVYGSVNVVPEYLILIDTAGFEDQQAKYVDAMLDRLIEEGVFVERYYFDGDPRACSLKPPGSPFLTLQDLSAKYPDHRLMVFSDGAGFIDPISGRPHSLIERFLPWRDRALMTPAPASHWGYRELSLSNWDFLVFPISERGLASFMETIHTGVQAKPQVNEISPPFPGILRSRPGRWLQPREPEASVTDTLCEQLEFYLGDRAYDWLRACSVYPMLQWEITLYLGHHLKLMTEPRLLSLVRLPWFRRGRMPDWLRHKLINSLSRGEDKKTRSVLEEMILSTLENPVGGFDLEVAPEDRKLKKNSRRRLLQDFLKSLPDDSPLRDYVFLSFMSGRKPTKTALRIPNLLRRVFFKEGLQIMGFRPATLGLLAVILSVVVLRTVNHYRPVQRAESAIPSFEIVKDKENQGPLPLNPPYAQSTESMIAYANRLLDPADEKTKTDLINRYLSDNHPETAATLLGNSSESFQLRSKLYQEWLRDHLIRDAKVPGDSFSFYTSDVVTSSERETAALYMLPKPTSSGGRTLVAGVPQDGGAGSKPPNANGNSNRSRGGNPGIPNKNLPGLFNLDRGLNIRIVEALVAANAKVIIVQKKPLETVPPDIFKRTFQEVGMDTTEMERFKTRLAQDFPTINKEILAFSSIPYRPIQESVDLVRDALDKHAAEPIPDRVSTLAGVAGDLTINVTDVYGKPIEEKVDIAISSTTSQETRILERDLDGSKTIILKHIFRMGGAPGVFSVQITPRSYLSVTKLIRIGAEVQTLNATVPIDPRRIASVELPPYSSLPGELRKLLEGSYSVSGFEKSQGKSLYDALDDIRKAQLLNMTAKGLATRLSNGRTVFSYLKSLSQIRSDSLVGEVDQDLMEEVDHSVTEKLFQSLRGGSPGSVPPNYRLSGAYSTPDAYGRMQLTFFEPGESPQQASRKPSLVSLNIAAPAMDRLFQVTGLPASAGPANPFSIHEILLFHQRLDPGYRFILESQTQSKR